MRSVRKVISVGSKSFNGSALASKRGAGARGLFTAFEEGNRPWSPPLTKIVATIGPTSEQFEDLQPLIKEGMRIMRLNFSHATYEEAELRINNLQKCAGRHSNSAVGKDNARAVLLDTQGPEIRSGKLAGDTTGKKSVQFVQGERVLLRTDDELKEASTEKEMYISYKDLVPTIKAHIAQYGKAKVLLDDGAVCLTVESFDEEAGTVTCMIDNTGDLRSRAGVNLPNASINLPPMSEKDKQDIRYGLKRDVDFVAASFIRDAAGVDEIRSFMRQVMTDEMGMPVDALLPKIISKIENTEALRNFDEILETSDGIMVARGDLGVEIPIHEVANSQKEIVAACNAVGKPVIVATQMLESMAKNPRPTRAEVADVTNAVYDGADCVMLSGETAKGKYCTEVVKTMTDIIRGAEAFAVRNEDNSKSKVTLRSTSSPFEAVAVAACGAAKVGNARAIIVLTDSGDTARLVAKQRPSMPILAFCPQSKVARQLIIHRGVHPILGANLKDLPEAERTAASVKAAKDMGFLKTGDSFVMVLRENKNEMDSLATMRIATVA